MATVSINGVNVKVKNGTSILKAAESIGLKIPTLCFLEEVNEIGFCRLCVVEVEGVQDLVSACNTPVKNKMRIFTDSKKVIDSRISTLQLLASRHRFDCWVCPKEGACEFYDMLKTHHVEFEEFGPSKGRNSSKIKGLGVNQDQSKCILCKRCVSVCAEHTSTRVLKFRDEDGLNPVVSPTIGLSFDESGCIACGQCISVCPTGTLYEADHLTQVEDLLYEKENFNVAQVTDEVKTALIEEFDLDKNLNLEKLEEMLSEALTMSGFDMITNVNFANDLTVLELASELQTRFNTGAPVPLISSVCPGAVNYVEMYQKNYIDYLSKVKGPHTLLGTLTKEYLAEKLEQDKKNIKVVSIVSCPARKTEISREDVNDVDAVLTIRELIRLFRKKEINFKELNGIKQDSLFSKASGAGSLFAVSGGLTTALIRTLYNVIEKKELDELEFNKLVYTEHNPAGSFKELKMKIGGTDFRFAVVDGGANMKDFFKTMDKKKKKYNFIELNACSSGCINGGLMPYNFEETVQENMLLRANLIYNDDRETKEIRKAHLNLKLESLYEELLVEPNSAKAHELLYRNFSQKDIDNN